MNRIPPPEGRDALPVPHATDEPSWRPPHPPPFDSHPPDYLRPLSTRIYPDLPHHELPELIQEGLYGARAFPQYPNFPHTNFRPPMNVAPREASPDDRTRMGYLPTNQINSAEYTPFSGPLPPASQSTAPLHQMAAATPPGRYDPAFYQYQIYGSRQLKTVRAQQACHQCRAKKAKCDEGQPNCSHCKKNGLTCVYKSPSPQKPDKATQLVLDRFLQTEDRLEIQISELYAIQQNHKLVLQNLFQGNKSARPIQVIEEHSLVPTPAFDHDPPLQEVSQTHTAGTSILDPVGQDVGTFGYGQQLGPAEPMYDDSTTEAEGEYSIPRLTSYWWPAIKKLLSPKGYDEDYVMRLEEERGLISIYGQGEISYTADGSQLPRYGGFDGVRLDGDGAGPDSDVEVDKFGNLKLDAATAQRYYESYLANMFNLHPFLEQDELNIKVDTFIRCYCRPSSSTSSTTDDMRSAHDGLPPAKRKRSKEKLGAPGESVETASNPPRPRVGKNIGNAMIMLCLALGAICEVPAPLPGPIMGHRIDYRSQPIPGSLSPLSQNGVYTANHVLSLANPAAVIQKWHSHYPYLLPMQPTSQPFPATLGETQGNLSRRCVSNTRDEQGNTRNHQVIPGLALYGYATAILGLLQGGNDLEHVQTGLLAGLYAGQLVHPLQSHSWIFQASRACQVLVGSKRYERLEEGPVKDLHKFAYWTCLQLESDLLADLDVPASGISRYEGRMGLPKGKFTITHLPDDPSAPASKMILYYLAQLHLHKLLNRVHTFLYEVENQGQTRWSSTVQQALSMNLELWRTSLPDSMKWKDSDEPADDINAARMRAKYYGAQYIIHRPLLYHALHHGHTGTRVGPFRHTSMESSTATQEMSSMMHQNNNLAANMLPMSSGTDSTSAASVAHGWTPPKVQLCELPKKLRMACKICIDSAIQSTEAFDGVGGHRLVVTNIFGTAHAQFGNMLVLSATYMSSLHELVDAELLERLLRRTVGFLTQSENISPNLRADARILTEVYQNIFHHALEMSPQPTKRK
ncbi:hypothetical protein N7499_006320 [Penicillium canescens]|nr:hypothetical protein N7499_006320 [Penicillium canescens]KAJ6176757.1 hypothetical protein N7485_003671 [Penicillium canescens]